MGGRIPNLCPIFVRKSKQTMKYFYLFHITFCTTSLIAQQDQSVSFSQTLSSSDDPIEVNWLSWEEAVQLNAVQPKKIYIDLYTDWCGWCKKMDKTTFVDPELVAYLNEHFYAIKFNAERKDPIEFNDHIFRYAEGGRRGVHELARALLNGRLGYPSFVLMDEEFARILISPGYKSPEEVLQELRFAHNELYKQMSFESYKNSIEPE